MASQELLNAQKRLAELRKRDGVKIPVSSLASSAIAPIEPTTAPKLPQTAVIQLPTQYPILGEIFAKRDIERAAQAATRTPRKPTEPKPTILHSNSIDLLGAIMGTYGIHALRAWVTHREYQINTGTNIALTALVKSTPQRDDKTYNAIKNNPELFSVSADGIVYRTGEKRLRAKLGLLADKWLFKLETADLKSKSTLHDAIVKSAINSLGDYRVASLPTLEKITQIPRRSIQKSIKRVKAYKKANYKQANTGTPSSNSFTFESTKSGANVTAQRIANSYFLRTDTPRPARTLRKRREKLLSEVNTLTTLDAIGTTPLVTEGNDNEAKKFFTPKQLAKRKQPPAHDHMIQTSHAITMRRNAPTRTTQWWLQVVVHQ